MLDSQGKGLFIISTVLFLVTFCKAKKTKHVSIGSDVLIEDVDDDNITIELRRGFTSDPTVSLPLLVTKSGASSLAPITTTALFKKTVQSSPDRIALSLKRKDNVRILDDIDYFHSIVVACYYRVE